MFFIRLAKSLLSFFWLFDMLNCKCWKYFVLNQNLGNKNLRSFQEATHFGSKTYFVTESKSFTIFKYQYERNK